MRALWTIVVLLLGPIAGALSGRKVRAIPSRRVIYVSNALNLVVLGAITAAVDLTHGRKAFDLLANLTRPTTLVICSAAVAAACIAVLAITLSLRIVLRWSPKSSVMALLPRSTAEKLAFTFLCILIALIEEFIYRGFVLSDLRDWLRSDTLAVALVSVSFALMHGLQDWIAIAGAFLQGIVLSIPVLLIHSLAASIVGHFSVDLCAGLFLFVVLQRFQLVPKET
jgi:membrane protease YdiL (CAAX protease family)